MASPTDIRGKLVLNKGQDEFRKLAEEAVSKLTTVRKVDGRNKRVFADFTVTIGASMDRSTFSIYRNRTSMMVISEQKGDVVSMSFEYVYIEDHLKELLKELDGKGTRN